MKQTDFTGKWALVTGASSGLGKDFAFLLAQQGCHLVLTARREQAMNALAAELREAFDVQVEVIPGDLSQAAFRVELLRSLAASGRSPDILINNAGFGLYGDFAQQNWADLDTMLEVDIRALTHLTHLVLPSMRKKRKGYILQVASVGGFQPSPTYAAYAAAKAYVLNFGEALNFELRQSGIHVSVLAPGVTQTEFLQVSGQQPTLYQRLIMMQSRPVAAAGLKALLKNRGSLVPGLANRLSVGSLRLIPRPLQSRIVHVLMQNR